MKLFEVTFKGDNSCLEIKKYIAKDVDQLLKFVICQRWGLTITKIELIPDVEDLANG